MRSIYLFGYLRKNNPFDLYWRKVVGSHFKKAGLIVLDPSRYHDVPNPGEMYEPNELVHRDVQDIDKSDILFGVLNPERGDRHPVGSLIELGMASQMHPQKLIALTCNDPSIYNHQFVKAIVTKQFRDYMTAVKYVLEQWI